MIDYLAWNVEAHISRCRRKNARSSTESGSRACPPCAAQALSGADAMSVDVEADGDGDVLLVKTDRILSPCENACAFHSRLVRNIMRTLAVKTLELNRKIEILSHRSTQDRLMSYLRAVAQQKGTAEFDVPFDRQQLADYRVERSALSAEISRLSKLGLITSRKSHFALRRTV